ncbi:type II secretion system protein [Patescibacteria group bacterium]|nr:MAG: type II secretion system protein [Patescibacteria group bacterium]
MKKESGFTLIELLVVISIISLLSSVVLTGLSSARSKARDSKRIQNAIQFRNALEIYRSSNNVYPPTNSSGYVAGGDGTLAPFVTTYLNGILSQAPQDPNGAGNFVYISDPVILNMTCGTKNTDPIPPYIIAISLESNGGNLPKLFITNNSAQFGSYYCITS